MQIADEIAELEKHEKKWSKEAVNEIEELNKRDAILAPYISEIQKHFGIEKIIYKRKE